MLKLEPPQPALSQLLATTPLTLTGGGGNRTRAGRCETPSRIAPLPRNRPECLGVGIPPRPLLSRPVPVHSARSCDIRATRRGLPTSRRRVIPCRVARRSHDRPERVARPSLPGSRARTAAGQKATGTNRVDAGAPFEASAACIPGLSPVLGKRCLTRHCP